MPKTPTKRAYDGFDAAYECFNKRLFAGRLPPCLITVRPHRGAYSYFSGERFGSRNGKEIHDEIALNIKHFQQRSPRETFAARKFAVPYYDRAGETDITRKKRKVAYTCPSCDDRVWGKPDVQPHCGKCGLVAMIALHDTNTADLAA